MFVLENDARVAGDARNPDEKQMTNFTAENPLVNARSVDKHALKHQINFVLHREDESIFEF